MKKHRVSVRKWRCDAGSDRGVVFWDLYCSDTKEYWGGACVTREEARELLKSKKKDSVICPLCDLGLALEAYSRAVKAG